MTPPRTLIAVLCFFWSALAVQSAELNHEEALKELAAPIVDGFSDPNAIVYNQFHYRCFVQYWSQAPIQCGAAQYEMRVSGKIVPFFGGLDEIYLGRRFDAEQCLRFLDARLAHDKRFTLFGVNARQPWERDIGSVLTLLAGAGIKDVIPRATKFLKDESSSIAMHSAWALMAFKSGAVEATPALIEVLASENQNVIGPAAQALEAIGADAVPQLLKALEHPKPLVYTFAAQILRKIKPPATLAVPAYIAFLERGGETLPRTEQIIAALGDYGADAKAAIPILSKRLADGTLGCAETLKRLGPRGQAALIEALKTPSAGRLRAAEALSFPPATTIAAIPALILAVAGNTSSAQNALYLHAALPDAKDALPAIVELLNHSSPYVRRSALDTLSFYGARARPALPALESFAEKTEDKGLSDEIARLIIRVKEKIAAEDAAKK